VPAKSIYQLSMKRLFFINRYFFPDHSATSQILSQLAFHLAESGHNVHVITSRQLYDDPDARLDVEDIHRGVVVHRLATTKRGRSRLLGRSFDYLSFYLSAWRLLNSLADRNDILIPMTDPPLLSILAWRLSHRRGSYVINWLQDIYPEVATELGVPLIKGPISKILSLARNASLRSADVNVVVGTRMAQKVSQLGVSSDRINVIPNWCDDEAIVPVGKDANPLRAEWHLQNKFVVGYSGNLGRAHEFETILAASKRLKNTPDIIFLLIGGGHWNADLAQQAQEAGLSDKFLFLPYQSNEVLRYSLSVPDVHWVSLRPELEGLIVPSKVYGIAAAGRPIIAVTAKDGEIARLIKAHDCGLVVEPGNSEEMAKAILQLSAKDEARIGMGLRARAMLDAEFTHRHAFRRWKNVVDTLVEQ
jgi:colanic acid biosynthesis glycosyl transferase WcaI